MKRITLLIILIIFTSTTAPCLTDESLSFGRFGAVTLYRESPHPSHVVIFVSGDGGWNKGVVDMARSLSSLDALVIGMDIGRYLQQLEKADEKCSYPAADFEALSQYIQKKLQFPSYVPPVLVGYSSGATLVYAVLVQAPPGTFQGAVSLGFCPDLPLSKTLCRGHGLEWKPGPKGKGYSFLPAATLQNPWIAFQGAIDQVCDAAAVQAYVKQVSQGEIVLLPKVGHGFSVQKNWMPQFRETFTRLVKTHEGAQAPERNELKDLPLVEVPAVGASSSTIAVIISGDGGWAGIDRDLGSALAGRGVPVIGLNSLQYFWKRRTPEGAAKDLERIIRYYLAVWNKQQVILIGYSLGADVLPFMACRLPEKLQAGIGLIALLGPSQTADFEFHFTDWLENLSRKTALPVRPEVEKLKGRKVLCFCGDKETDSLCKDLDPALAHTFILKGAHHFDGNYKALAEIILRELGQ